MGERKRTEISLKQKLDIIAACEGPPKQTYAAVAKIFNIDSSTVIKKYVV